MQFLNQLWQRIRNWLDRVLDIFKPRTPVPKRVLGLDVFGILSNWNGRLGKETRGLRVMASALAADAEKLKQRAAEAERMKQTALGIQGSFTALDDSKRIDELKLRLAGLETGLAKASAELNGNVP